MNPELKTEKMYRELERLGAVLGVPVPQCHLTLETFDKNGKRLSYHKQRSHSWVRNAYNCMVSLITRIDMSDSDWGAGYINMKDIAGSIQHASYSPGTYNVVGSSSQSVGKGYRGAATVEELGIQVGTGTNAESYEDYALQTLIISGNGSGELAYGEVEAPSKSYVAGTKTYSVAWIRYFNNNSGGSITVNEIGIASLLSLATQIYQSLMARDKLGSGVEVADTGQLKVT